VQVVDGEIQREIFARAEREPALPEMFVLNGFADSLLGNIEPAVRFLR